MSGAGAVLLAAIGPAEGGAQTEALTGPQRARLKAALELPGAAIAVTGGGEYLGVYSSPGVAVEAAIAFQLAADELAAGSPLAQTGRVVLDLWPAESEPMPVEHAREILGHTRSHCILITPGFAGEMPAEQRINLVHYEGARSKPALRGVVELMWRDRVTTFRESTRPLRAGRKDQHYRAVMLTRRGRHMIVRPGDCPFSMGRDSACALVLGGSDVSRLHGAIQHDGGRFYLRDDSRNGTYLTTGGEEVFLRGERFPLVSKGVVSPGAPLLQQISDVIRYQCLTSDPGEISDED